MLLNRGWEVKKRRAMWQVEPSSIYVSWCRNSRPRVELECWRQSATRKKVQDRLWVERLKRFIWQRSCKKGRKRRPAALVDEKIGRSNTDPGTTSINTAICCRCIHGRIDNTDSWWLLIQQRQMGGSALTSELMAQQNKTLGRNNTMMMISCCHGYYTSQFMPASLAWHVFDIRKAAICWHTIRERMSPSLHNITQTATIYTIGYSCYLILSHVVQANIRKHVITEQCTRTMLVCRPSFRLHVRSSPSCPAYVNSTDDIFPSHGWVFIRVNRMLPFSWEEMHTS